MKYYSQYRSHDLCELQESLSGLSKSNRWVKLTDHFPWGRIEKETTNARGTVTTVPATSPVVMFV